MKKATFLEFIKKHTSVIEKARWVSDSKNKTLTTNVIADSKNMLVDLTLNNWDGFGDAEIGIGDIPKFNRELSGLVDEDVTAVLNYNDDKTRIVSVNVMDSSSVATITTSDLEMIGASSRLKSNPPISAEIIFDADMKERFLKAKSALPDVKTFTLLMNKKNELEMIIGYSKINSSRYTLKVKTNPGKDTVEGPLHFRSDYFKEALSVNSNAGDSVLYVSNNGLCTISFVEGDFSVKYHFSTTDDQD